MTGEIKTMESIPISFPDSEAMIAGKTHSEILSMIRWMRSQWYTTISPDEKEEAMRVIETVRRAKISGAYTPERRVKHSIAMSGENNPMKRPEVRAKFRGKNNPMKRPEVKAKISGRNNPAKRPSVRVKISAANAARTHSEESRAKQSASIIELWKDPEYRNKHSGKNHSQFGKPRTEKTKAKISAANSGANSANWRGGISFEPYGIEFNNKLKNQIRERDNHTCQECLCTEEQLGRALDIHHIDYCKTNNSPENLISLCRSCHAQTNFSREDWTEYFRTHVLSFSQIRGRE